MQQRPRRGPGAAAAAARVSSPAADWIADNLGCGHVTSQKSLGGSGWASTAVLTAESGREFFVKTSGGSKAEAMFQGEALGLTALAGTRAVRVPEVAHVGTLPRGGGAFIIMEHLALGGPPDMAALGRAVAAMHAAAPAVRRGAAGRAPWGARAGGRRLLAARVGRRGRLPLTPRYA
ncbi:MAG: Fructosamine kinase-domain-containing protein [Monoraphidium minutum]|nr:MAG: Fructosamine kinase-domain-containing protein [Monoraphidium minutum]